MSSSFRMSGDENSLRRYVREAAQYETDYDAAVDAANLKLHQKLSPDLQSIVANTRARLIDWTSKQDLGAVVAMNNVLALHFKEVRDALASNDLERIALRGWQVSTINQEDLRKVRRNGGYCFLLEHVEGESVTPYGYQFGFPSAPPAYPNLSVKSLPQSVLFRNDPESQWTIWRTGILENVEDIRNRYNELRIPIHAALEGKNLHRLGAGQATKLVDAIAAVDLNKKIVQCNIGQIVDVASKKLLAKNQASVGSNEEVFDCTSVMRLYADHIPPSPKRSPPNNRKGRKDPIIEFLWTLYRASPEKMLERLLRDGGALRKKVWPIEQLIETGHALANELRSRK